MVISTPDLIPEATFTMEIVCFFLTMIQQQIKNDRDEFVL